MEGERGNQPSATLQEVERTGAGDGLGAIVYPELVVDVDGVPLDRAGADK